MKKTGKKPKEGLEVNEIIEAEIDKEVMESQAELSAKEKSPDEIRGEFLDRAVCLKELMQKKYFELTGKKDSFEMDDLYRNKVREMMVNVRIISPEAYIALKEDCQIKGKVDPLSKIKDKNEIIGKEVKKCLREISEEATELEDISLLFIKSYANGGHIAPSLFVGQLATYFSDQSINKKRVEMGLAMQKDLNEYVQKEEKKTALSQGEKDETFKAMSAARRNSYIVSKKNLHEKGLLHEGKLKNYHKAIDTFRNDPAIANDLRIFLRYDQKFYIEAHDLHLLQAEKTIRQADILGLHL